MINKYISNTKRPTVLTACFVLGFSLLGCGGYEKADNPKACLRNLAQALKKEDNEALKRLTNGSIQILGSKIENKGDSEELAEFFTSGDELLKLIEDGSFNFSQLLGTEVATHSNSSGELRFQFSKDPETGEYRIMAVKVVKSPEEMAREMTAKQSGQTEATSKISEKVAQHGAARSAIQKVAEQFHKSLKTGDVSGMASFIDTPSCREHIKANSSMSESELATVGLEHLKHVYSSDQLEMAIERDSSGEIMVYTDPTELAWYLGKATFTLKGSTHPDFVVEIRGQWDGPAKIHAIPHSVLQPNQYQEARSSIAAIQAAIDGYQVMNGAYPKSLAEFFSSTKDKLPSTDPWRREWVYRTQDDGFYLGSKGENTASEDDDIFYDSSEGRIINLKAGERRTE